jgi:hypothetical protein
MRAHLYDMRPALGPDLESRRTGAMMLQKFCSGRIYILERASLILIHR